MKAILREIAITLLMALVLFLGIHYTIQNTEVISGSMIPTLSIGERMFIYKLAYKFGHLPQRGDIIVFIPPASVNSDKDYIKRIIGLPGEVVEIKSGVVYIHRVDGSVVTLDEPYVTTPANTDYMSGTIPAGQYFVMGDNRNNSNDSRYWGTVPIGSIVGRAWWVTWPFSKFGSAPNYKLPK